MKSSRRLSRMMKAGSQPATRLNIVPLMDVFTILVFFLLVNSTASDVMETPKTIKLPASFVEHKPRETVSVMVTENEILIQGEYIISIDEIMATEETEVPAIMRSLLEQRKRIIGISERSLADSSEVTILAHKALPYELIRKIMSSCTYAGYEKISLAVMQKSTRNK